MPKPPAITPASIKALRAARGLSAAQLAAKCGVSRRTVEGWEQGRPPSGPARLVLSALLSKKS